MSDPHSDATPEDKLLEDYLHRKSALSMGYRRVYIEAPPPELDQAIAARARRALRFLVPGVLAVVIGLGSLVGISFSMRLIVQQMVIVEKNAKRAEKERLEEEARARDSAPIAVIVDPMALAPGVPTREQWVTKIEKLKRAGKQAEADEELKKFRAAYPEKK